MTRVGFVLARSTHLVATTFPAVTDDKLSGSSTASQLSYAGMISTISDLEDKCLFSDLIEVKNDLENIVYDLIFAIHKYHHLEYLIESLIIVINQLISVVALKENLKARFLLSQNHPVVSDDADQPGEISTESKRMLEDDWNLVDKIIEKAAQTCTSLPNILSYFQSKIYAAKLANCLRESNFEEAKKYLMKTWGMILVAVRKGYIKQADDCFEEIASILRNNVGFIMSETEISVFVDEVCPKRTEKYFNELYFLLLDPKLLIYSITLAHLEYPDERMLDKLQNLKSQIYRPYNKEEWTSNFEEPILECMREKIMGVQSSATITNLFLRTARMLLFVEQFGNNAMVKNLSIKINDLYFQAIKGLVVLELPNGDKNILLESLESQIKSLKNVLDLDPNFVINSQLNVRDCLFKLQDIKVIDEREAISLFRALKESIQVLNLQNRVSEDIFISVKKYICNKVSNAFPELTQFEGGMTKEVLIRNLDAARNPDELFYFIKKLSSLSKRVLSAITVFGNVTPTDRLIELLKGIYSDTFLFPASVPTILPNPALPAPAAAQLSI